MRCSKRVGVGIISILLSVCLWGNYTLVSRAEGTSLPGYHEYTVSEDETIDAWYGIARGTYLQGGITGLKKAGTAKMNVSGTTNANSTCDKVKAAVYLDESSNGGSSFGTIGSYYFEETNATNCHGSKANISVTSGWKYRVRGVHTVIEGDVIESMTTGTTVLTAS